MLDEFQEITDIDRHLPRLMRAVFQRQPEVAHVYLGSKRHMLRRIFSDAQRAVLAQREADGARRDRAASCSRAYIVERFGATGKSIDGEARRAHPRAHARPSVRDAGALLLRLGGDRGETHRFARGGRAGADGVLHSEHAHFSLLWDGAASGQRLLLQALAAEPGRPYTAAYRREHGLPAATNVQKALAALRRRELVATAKDGTVSIAEPFFAEWIARLGT